MNNILFYEKVLSSVFFETKLVFFNLVHFLEKENWLISTNTEPNNIKRMYFLSRMFVDPDFRAPGAYKMELSRTKKLWLD